MGDTAERPDIEKIKEGFKNNIKAMSTMEYIDWSAEDGLKLIAWIEEQDKRIESLEAYRGLF